MNEFFILSYERISRTINPGFTFQLYNKVYFKEGNVIKSSYILDETILTSNLYI